MAMSKCAKVTFLFSLNYLHLSLLVLNLYFFLFRHVKNNFKFAGRCVVVMV